MNTVTIYSTPTCTYCNMAKTFFKANNIAYTEHNVAADLAKRKEMVEKTSQMGVPVIEINNETVIGFDEARVRELLKIA
ncbi:MAG: glutaredoxin family protein [Patescibacteria group bacterium]